MKEKLLGFSYLVVIACLFLYSFTQVNLGFAFSRSEFLQNILFSFQQVGYFQRNLSTILYILIIISLFLSYLVFLYFSYKGKLKRRYIWGLIILTAIVLNFSYSAFSKDIFNYIFDAKILAIYHQNPYLHSALDFPNDPMLSFLEWIQRKYPYGPIWLGLTAPLAFLGKGILIPTFFLFKTLNSLFYIGTAFFIEKIAKRISPKFALWSLVFFAFNPLIIIESLVSSHNDIAMMFFAICGIYWLFAEKFKLATLFIISSFLIKVPTIALIGPSALFIISRTRKKLGYDNFLKLCLLSLSLALYYFLYHYLDVKYNMVEMQPWYFIWFIPLISLIRYNKYITLTGLIMSAILLLKYPSYLISGEWASPISYLYRAFISVFMPIALIITTLLSYDYKRLKNEIFRKI